jgi:integrase
VGRIRCSSGTARLAEFRKRDGILTKLYDDAQLETLRALARGQISIEQLVEADRIGRLRGADLLADMALHKSLWQSVDELVPTLGRGPETRRRYATSLQKMRSLASTWLSDEARVSDLSRVPWNRLEALWGGSAADWNHLRRAVSTLLTAILGDVHHAFRRGVVKTIPVRTERARVPELSPEDFHRILAATPEHARPCYMVLAATGMRLGEYLRCTRAHLNPLTHSIQVPGTKTAASAATVFVHRELWPWVEQGVPSPLQRRWMWLYWKRACRAVGLPDLRLHDLRHFYAQQADEGGASTVSVMAALRHTNPAMTRNYATRKERGAVANVVGLRILQAKAS